VRPAPIEGAAVLAGEAIARLGGIDASVLAEAQAALRDPGISLVDAALLATELGAKALHDPTEGGLAGGLYEMAAAAGVGIRVDREAVLWFEPGLAVCRALDCDPWSTLASGTLLAAFAPDAAEGALAAFAERGLPAAVIGNVEAGEGVVDAGGSALVSPRATKWRAFSAADPRRPALSRTSARDGRAPALVAQLVLLYLGAFVILFAGSSCSAGWRASTYGAFFGWSAPVFAAVAAVAVCSICRASVSRPGCSPRPLIAFVFPGLLPDLIRLLDPDALIDGFQRRLAAPPRDDDRSRSR
jgi:hypothetical protein